MKPRYRTVLLILLALGIVFQAYNILAPERKNFVVCPVDAIRMVGGKAVIDSSKCIGCRRCVDGFYIAPAKPAAVEPKDFQSTLVPLSPEPTAESQPLQPQASTQVPAPTSEKQAYQVEPKACIGCGLCVHICPTEAIKLVDGKAIIDKDLCINCGICKNGNNADFQGCPVLAISAP